MRFFRETNKICTINVPYKYYLFAFVTQLIVLNLIIQLIKCEQYHFRPEASQNNYYFEENIEFSSDERQIGQINPEPTPPLDSNSIASFKNKRHINYNNEEGGSGQISKEQYTDEYIDSISPARVLEGHYAYGPDSNLFSPIFNFQLVDPLNLSQNENIYRNAQQPAQQQAQNLPDTNNVFDLIEPGSGVGAGVGWDSQLHDDTSNIMEDSTTLNEYDPTQTAIMPTPVLTPGFPQQTPSVGGDQNNQAPTLNRRLPKLAIIAGQFWKYFIPVDTFTDEDGDLRQLKSMILLKKPTNDASNKVDMKFDESTRNSVGQYYSWLQYDQRSQSLYGFPTENDAGKHEIVLAVSDKWGATSEETIEITVRQHPSTRAFTHLFVINRVQWDRQRYPSMVDALGEFIRRVSTQVYLDHTIRNFIVQYYNIDNQETITNNSTDQTKPNIDLQIDRTNTNLSFTIAWSNGSVPVYPCNISHLENLSRLLIDNKTLNVNWSLEKGERQELAPSQNMIRAIGYEFKSSSISIYLQGACEGKDSVQSNNVQDFDNIELAPRVRIKIGKLTWKLGEPIEYKIPVETFEAERGTYNTRNFQLTLHTIDGLTLDKDPKYSFLEFHQESQMLYGLPYSQADHAGQREMQLTARHPKSGQKVREVFIINIEPQDLTTINNRAFRLSLYLTPRTGSFGPKERVSLSHKVIGALRIGDSEFHHDRENPELVVMDIQKFAIDSHSKNDASLNNNQLDANSYQDKIVRMMDSANNQGDDLYVSREVANREGDVDKAKLFYKYTWTNGTIGYRGDCPVEVIRENVLSALEQSMLEFKLSDTSIVEDSSKNDSMRFYERLRLYFEPNSDLIHLRFEPLGACERALELHDVGDSEIADQADRAGIWPLEISQEIFALTTLSPVVPKPEIEPNNDEYWSIVVLIVLVVALIFVIIMFFMGMHTYKINQDKRFELQVRLAQARQNSMYYSSLFLANQANQNQICGQMIVPGAAKSMYVVQDEERGSRKPVILDNEKQLLTSGQHSSPGLKPTSVHLSGQTIHTTSLKPNMSFTLDSIASSWQPGINTINSSTSTVMQTYLGDQQRSMTLNRRPSNSSQQMSSMNLNHSQSILTVASLAGPLPVITQGHLPIVYAQVPEFAVQSPQHYSSLQRFSQDRFHGVPMASVFAQDLHPAYMPPNEQIQPASKTHAQKMQANNGVNSQLFLSPSYSSSTSATTQSVISNPNYYAPPNPH